MTPEARSAAKAADAAKKKADVASGAAAAVEEECAICLEPLSQSPSQTLPCTHEYHLECVKQMRSFGINEACPMCRAELPPGPEKLFRDAIRRFVALDRRYSQGVNKPWRRISDDRDRRESAEVARVLHEAAEEGCAPAQSHLAGLYSLGTCGLTQSDALAMEWYRKAADQGYAHGQNGLGFMYFEGKGGLSQSDSMAVKWYRKAAKQEHADAQCNLGIMHHHGRGGLPQSEAMAAEWYRKAAEQEHAHAQFHLGGLYALGTGVPQDFSEALRLIRKAQIGGCDEDRATKAIQTLQELQRNATEQAEEDQLREREVQRALLPIGTRVELRGLQAKPELNGGWGVVAGFDAASGRIKVKLEDGRGPFKFKADNVFLRVDARSAMERGVAAAARLDKKKKG